MDALLLSLLAHEVEAGWAGAWVQQAWQDAHGRLVLQLRRSGPKAETRFLLLSPLPEAQGLGTLSCRPPCPPRPPALAAYLRAHVCGGRLEAARRVPGERVVELSLRGRDGLYRLILEATGRRGNLVVLDAAGLVRAAWRWEPAESHPRRPLEPGRGYALPPRPEEVRTGRASASPLAVEETLDEAGARLEKVLAEARSRAEAAAAEAQARAKRKRLDRRLARIRADLAELPDPAGVRAEADALAAALWQVRKGDDEARVPDLADPTKELAIPLDVSLTPGENLNRLYDRARRASRARAAAAARLEVTLEELEAVVRPGCSVETKPEGREQPGLPYRRFRASNGWSVWVGRNGKENDRLLREARPWDLWLHAREVPGAHVVLRLPSREARVPDGVLAEAAELAARYSRASKEAAVDVAVAEAARVRKPKGASPGRVVVAGERTVRVRPAG